jgi:hypothetical protein
MHLTYPTRKKPGLAGASYKRCASHLQVGTPAISDSIKGPVIL